LTTAEAITPAVREPESRPRLRFDRNELAGAFGDIGTDLPLIIGMIAASGLNSASVLVMFGLMQFLTAFAYGMPMAVQPLKAVAVIVITQHIAPGVLYGGGFSIGVAMLILTITGGIDWLGRVVPRAVVRGLQLGLGLQLSLLALGNYVQRDGDAGAAGKAVRIEGHTDAKGSEAYNKQLSIRRAESVKSWLIEKEGLGDRSFSTEGFGAKKPVAPNVKPDGSDDPEGRQKNRRVEIVLSKS